MIQTLIKDYIRKCLIFNRIVDLGSENMVRLKTDVLDYEDLMGDLKEALLRFLHFKGISYGLWKKQFNYWIQ